MRNTKTCGEAIVALLEQYEVEVVFGIPGVHTLELYRGLVGSRIRHVLPRHEQGAGFMADGYARASGKPGVCFLITGPGVTNAATPIGQAYSDSVPMLVISSVNETHHLGRGRGELHELPDQQKLMSACTAFSARVETPADFPGLLARAFDVFNSARPRPVHIEVPIDIFAQEVGEDWTPQAAAMKPQADSNAIQQAAGLLSEASNPLMIAGGGAIGAEAAVLALADKLAAPVVTTVAASGILPCSHPLSLGPTLVSAATHELVSTADVVLVAGSELASTEIWGNEYAFNGRLIRIDIDAGQFGNGPKADIELHGDAPAVLDALSKEVRAAANDARTKSTAGRVAAALAAYDESLDEAERLRRKVFETVVDALPEKTLVACDMTQIGYTGHAVFRPETSGRMLFPQGYGTLGYGLPAGIGARLGAMEKPVVVFTGDGGILYTIQEMATAVEEKLPVIVLLWNNQSLKQIRDGFIELGIEPIAVDPQVPDFQMLAGGFGWQAVQITALENLAGAVRKAHESGRTDGMPVLIEVMANAL
ncbi:5-guanidino-2-oxopentanoate decarboxylase [Salaquimonas pukyongi]|uniref:5-guanidino-2-oxopentanoate decarboxylase n=1 Tax=Salaquimonas pukyongi TaxID=2712698 RepID=UPI00096BB1C1|nr:5-guanidino-2-oxopentanoate decarboxylase [Salaquimonas pukyongi]